MLLNNSSTKVTAVENPGRNCAIHKEVYNCWNYG